MPGRTRTWCNLELQTHTSACGCSRQLWEERGRAFSNNRGKQEQKRTAHTEQSAPSGDSKHPQEWKKEGSVWRLPRPAICTNISSAPAGGSKHHTPPPTKEKGMSPRLRDVTSQFTANAPSGDSQQTQIIERGAHQRFLRGIGCSNSTQQAVRNHTPPCRMQKESLRVVGAGLDWGFTTQGQGLRVGHNQILPELT